MMRSVDVVIPLSSVLDPDRSRAFKHVISSVQAFQPKSIVVCECSPDGYPHADIPTGIVRAVVQSPWNKPVAVNEAVLKYTTAEWIFVLDADVSMDFTEVRSKFEALSSDIQFVRPCKHIARLSKEVTGKYIAGERSSVACDDVRNETLLTGGAFLIKRDLFLALRGFDERLDIYMEDTDFKYRLQKATQNIISFETQGYHLWHVPLSRTLTKFVGVVRGKKDLSLRMATVETESRIPLNKELQELKADTKVETAKDTQALVAGHSIDVIIPIDDASGKKRQALGCVLGSLDTLSPSNIFVCCTKLPENLPFKITVCLGVSLADAVAKALQASTAHWLCVQNPFMLLRHDKTSKFIEQDSKSYDVLKLVNKALMLSPAAAQRVISGARTVRKTDGVLKAPPALSSMLIKRSSLAAVPLHPDMSSEGIANAVLASGKRKPMQTTVQKLTGMMLEAATIPQLGKTKRESIAPTLVKVNKAERIALVNKEQRRKEILTKLHHKNAVGASESVLAAMGELTPTITVAVQCHATYIGVVSKCLDAIDAQSYTPSEKILILDSCDVSKEIEKKYAHWTIVRRKDGSPNPGRNAALKMSKCDWIWFVDADDIPHQDYLKSAARLTGDHRVGAIHADLAYSNGVTRKTPEDTDYWGLRLNNYVSTESVWRVAALREAGGWQPTLKWDDWICALNVTALGWRTAKNPIPIQVTVHSTDNHRNVPGLREFPHKWFRSYCVVSLLAGRRDIWKDWTNAVLTMKYPPKTTFLFLDNSKDPSFAALVKQLVMDLMQKGYTATYIKDDMAGDNVDRYSRSRVVAHLYNRICSKITEDVTVLWEDDNIPTNPNALKQMVENWDITKVGGICAVYESRNGPGRACGTYNKDFWGVMPPLDTMKGKLNKGLGFIPGGFACYHTALIMQAMPFHVDYPDGKADGWDGKLSRTVRSAGMDLVLDGTIECEHRFRGTK